MFGDSPWHITSFLRSIDRFGQNIPAFNINGASVIRTTIGGILTGIVITLTLIYFIVKLEALIDGSDPIINQNTISDYYGSAESSNGLDLFAANLHFAINISDFSGFPLYDSRYVKLIASLIHVNEDY